MNRDQETVCACGAPKRSRSKRCRPCSNRTTAAGRCRLNHDCVDCGKRVAKGARRCRPCWGLSNVGPANPKWRGGRYVGKNGYVYLNLAHLGDAVAHYRRPTQVTEHTWVMEQQLGRPLRRGESVHHKNGVKHDNRPGNLELWVKSQPAGQRVEDLVEWAREILTVYT